MAVSDEIKKWVAESVAGWTLNKFFPRQAHQRTSGGAASKGLPIVLNRDGVIDPSFFTVSGDWTPQVWDAASAGNQGAPVTANGKYIKVGLKVTVWGQIDDINTTGMTAGNSLFIRNFPYPTVTGMSYYGTAAVRNTTLTGHTLAVHMLGTGDTNLRPSATAAVGQPLLVSAFTSTTASIRFHLEYLTT